MRALRVIAATALVLGACGDGADKAAPTPAETVSAEATSDAVVSAPAVLTDAQLRRVCQAGLAAVHGQDADAIEVEGVANGVVTANWRAPVDGGRMRTECRVEKDLISWKPLDLPDPAQVRWMNQAGDPVVRFTLDADKISITQTLPDGTSEQSQATVSVAQEAR